MDRKLGDLPPEVIHSAIGQELAPYGARRVCRALGLSGFANDPFLRGADPTFRVVLLQSHFPEVCISFARRGDQQKLHVTAFLEWFYPARQHIALPPYAEEMIDLHQGEGEIVFKAMESFLADWEKGIRPKGILIHGGTPMDLVFLKDGKTKYLHTNSIHGMDMFLGPLCELVLKHLTRDNCRLAVREIARSVGRFDLAGPMQFQPKSSSPRNLLILGPVEDVDATSRAIRRRKND